MTCFLCCSPHVRNNYLQIWSSFRQCCLQISLYFDCFLFRLDLLPLHTHTWSTCSGIGVIFILFLLLSSATNWMGKEREDWVRGIGFSRKWTLKQHRSVQLKMIMKIWRLKIETRILPHQHHDVIFLSHHWQGQRSTKTQFLPNNSSNIPRRCKVILILFNIN